MGIKDVANKYTVNVGKKYISNHINTVNKMLYGGGDKKPQWAKWWNQLGANVAAGDQKSVDFLNNLIQTVVDTMGVNGWDDLSADMQSNIAITAYTSVNNGNDYSTPNSKVFKDIAAYTTKTPEGMEYTKTWDQFKKEWNNVFTKTGEYNKEKYKSADDLKAAFDDYYKTGAGGSSTVSYVLDKVKAEYIADKDAGLIDAKGNPIKAGTTPVVDTINSIYTKLGLPTPDTATAEHWQKEMKNNDADAWEIEQAIKATDPSYQLLQLEKAYKEFEPTLAATHAEELNNLKTLVSSAEKETTEYFNKEIIPAVRRTALELGGRDDTYTSDAFAKSAADLAKNRENYVIEQTNQINQADINRRLAAKAGQFDAAQQIRANDVATGKGIYANILAEDANLSDAISKFNVAKETKMFERLVDRQNRDAQKEATRLLNVQKDAWRAANKKASKYGMFANILQGAITGGFASKSWQGALAGAAGGYGVSKLQNQAADYSALTGTSSPYTTSGNGEFYSNLGKMTMSDEAYNRRYGNND